MDGIEQYIKITRLYYINVNSKIEYFLFGSVGVKSSFIDIMFRSGTTMAVMP